MILSMRLLIAAAALLLVTGCGTTAHGSSVGGSPVRETHHHEHAAKADASTPYKFDGHGVNVTARQFGKAWPLTIRSGRVNCIPIKAGGYHLVVGIFTANNNARYWLNGTATERARALSLRNIRHIWADDPAAPGLKEDISPLTDVCAALMN
jgi:hypothetical protein